MNINNTPTECMSILEGIITNVANSIQVLEKPSNDQPNSDDNITNNNNNQTCENNNNNSDIIIDGINSNNLGQEQYEEIDVFPFYEHFPIQEYLSLTDEELGIATSIFNNANIEVMLEKMNKFMANYEKDKEDMLQMQQEVLKGVKQLEYNLFNILKTQNQKSNSHGENIIINKANNIKKKLTTEIEESITPKVLSKIDQNSSVKQSKKNNCYQPTSGYYLRKSASKRENPDNMEGNENDENVPKRGKCVGLSKKKISSKKAAQPKYYTPANAQRQYY